MVGLGGQLSAAEDRQATVQDLEGRLARLSEQADVYQVRWGQEGKGTGQETKHQPAMPRRRKRPRLTLAPSPPRLPFPTLRPTITPYSCTTLPTPQARDGISRLPRTEYPRGNISLLHPSPPSPLRRATTSSASPAPSTRPWGRYRRRSNPLATCGAARPSGGAASPSGWTAPCQMWMQRPWLPAWTREGGCAAVATAAIGAAAAAADPTAGAAAAAASAAMDGEGEAGPPCRRRARVQVPALHRQAGEAAVLLTPAPHRARDRVQVVALHRQAGEAAVRPRPGGGGGGARTAAGLPAAPARHRRAAQPRAAGAALGQDQRGCGIQCARGQRWGLLPLGWGTGAVGALRWDGGGELLGGRCACCMP